MSQLYELNNIEQYYDGKKVLSIDSLSLSENQIIGFFGPNGSGKSTLFSLLSFIDKPSEGEIIFNGIDSRKMDAKLRQSVVIVPQNPYLLKRTVFDNVAYGLKLRNETEALTQRVYEALSLVGLNPEFSKRKWSQLSGGEAQRVALAARLILKPKVLILDEPTSGVDTNSAQMIKEAIFLAKQKWNTTLFISSHDHNWLNHACDRKVALFHGNLVESGSVNLLFAPWEKDEEGNLVKIFQDGQHLTIANSKNKKKDSVAMINCKNITINAKVSERTLLGVVSSIKQLQGDILIEFLIGGVTFSCKMNRDKIQELMLLPGDTIEVSIDTREVIWM